MKKTLAALALCAAVASQAHAAIAIVDHGDYLTDTVTGLDWLDVTKSTNMSFDFVSTQFGAGGLFAGWRYATGNEFNALIGSFTGSTPMTYGHVNQEVDKIDGLSSLLGSTLDIFYISTIGVTYDAQQGRQEGAGRDYTNGIIADIDIFTPNAQFVALIDDHDMTMNNIDSTMAHASLVSRHIPFLTVGSFLIRQTNQIATNNVPEPSTLALLGLGLLGFAANRRKAKSK